jgi:SdpI/YfhL protein family
MRRKTMARRFISILPNSRLALFAFGVFALGLPSGLLPVSGAIAEEPAKQAPPSDDQGIAADHNEAIRLNPQDVEHTAHRNEASQQDKAFRQKEPPEPISWWTVFAFALLGFLFAGIGIPLILEKVPPNPWYGFRVQTTLENPAVWYPVNRYLGKCLLGFGLFVIATSVGLSFVPRINPLIYVLSCVGALVVGSHVMLIMCVLFLQSVSPRHITLRDSSAE